MPDVDSLGSEARIHATGNDCRCCIARTDAPKTAIPLTSRPATVTGTMLRTLDLFLLTLIRDGITTPYDRQARAGVSLGASLPAVRRLLAGGLVREADEGPRGRREFAVTRSGRSELQRTDPYLQHALDEAHGDLESALRLVCIAVSEGKPSKRGKCCYKPPTSTPSDPGVRGSERLCNRTTIL